MTAKDRLNRIKTVINGGGVYRDYTDSTQVFNADISEVEKALTELEELKQEVIERQETEESLGKELIKIGDELEQLKRDVKEFMDLQLHATFDVYEAKMFLELKSKLMKVGREE